MSDLQEQIVEQLKLRFPSPWFKDWFVRTYQGDPNIYHAFVTATALPELPIIATLVLEHLAEVLAAVRALPLPAAPDADADAEWLIEHFTDVLVFARKDRERVKAIAASLRSPGVREAGEQRINQLQDERAADYAKWFAILGGVGLTEYQPECATMIDAALRELVALRAAAANTLSLRERIEAFLLKPILHRSESEAGQLLMSVSAALASPAPAATPTTEDAEPSREDDPIYFIWHSEPLTEIRLSEVINNFYSDCHLISQEDVAQLIDHIGRLRAKLRAATPAPAVTPDEEEIERAWKAKHPGSLGAPGFYHAGYRDGAATPAPALAQLREAAEGLAKALEIIEHGATHGCDQNANRTDCVWCAIQFTAREALKQWKAALATSWRAGMKLQVECNLASRDTNPKAPIYLTHRNENL
jgi:hypothetical protein